MRGLWVVCAAAAASAGCADLLGIHPLDETGMDDAPVIDGMPADAIDAPEVDALDAAIDAVDAAMIDGPDAPPIDAAMIDAASIDAPAIDAAIDAPPIDAGTVPIGEYAMLSGNAPISGNTIVARRFSVGSDTVIVGAGAYLTAEAPGGRLKFAIYTDNANAPYTRLNVSGDLTLDGTAGRSEIAIGPRTLTAGNTYWMILAVDMAASIGSLDTNNVTGAASSIAYSSAFPTQYSPQPISGSNYDRINLYLQAQP